MTRNKILVAAFAAALTIGGTAAVAMAETSVPDDEATTPVVLQTQTQDRLQIHDPALVGTEDAIQLQTQTRDRLQIQDPALASEDALQVQEQVRARGSRRGWERRPERHHVPDHDPDQDPGPGPG